MAPDFRDLPYLGLGLSTNLGPADVPDPWRLVEAKPGLFDYVEYSAPLHVSEARREAARFPLLMSRREVLPPVYHPVHLNLWGPALESLERLAALDAHLLEVGSPWVGNDVGWWHVNGTPLPGYLYVPPPMTEAGVRDAATHARHVQAHLSVPLLLETPATQARTGPLHVLDFMARLHEATGLGLILDLGHLFSHQLAYGRPLDAGFEGFPFEAVVEIHIAGGVVTARDERRFYVDDHAQPVREELFGLLAEVLPRCTGLKGVTFEGDGHPDGIAALTLARLRPLVPPPPAEPRSAATAAPSGTAAGEHAEPSEAEPWTWFERAYGIAPHPDDPAGMAAETDYRLAVLAARIDRDHALSRRAVAPDRSGLAAFAASDAFAASFGRGAPKTGAKRAAGPPGDVGAAFARWVRARLEDDPDAGIARLLAFETFLLGLLDKAAAPAPKEGRLALGRGVALGRFPEDLSEVLFAARRLEPHLEGRAFASGRVEASGFSSLVQAARRPAPGPWPLAVRRAGGKVECVGLDAPLAAVLSAASRGVPGDAVLQTGAAYREAMHRGLVQGLVQVG